MGLGALGLFELADWPLARLARVVLKREGCPHVDTLDFRSSHQLEERLVTMLHGAAGLEGVARMPRSHDEGVLSVYPARAELEPAVLSDGVGVDRLVKEVVLGTDD